MKKVLLIIPKTSYQAVKKVLGLQGFIGFSSFNVQDRGTEAISRRMTDVGQTTVEPLQLPFIPKKLVMLVIPDAEETKLIQLVKTVDGLTGRGGAKIIIIPVKEGFRIRTGESGLEAIV